MLISDWSSDVCSSDLAPSIDVVTRQAVERGFFVIGRDRRPRIDEDLRIKGPDRPCAGLAIAAGIRPQHDRKTVAGVDRKRQSSGEIVLVLVRSKERGVGKDGVSTGRSWWWTEQYTKKQKNK